MTSIGFGPLSRIEGPPPDEQLYGLLNAAESAAGTVRLITEADDRWANGAEVYPYPPHPGNTFNPCAPASEAQDKDTGEEVELKHPTFEAITAYVPDSCTIFSAGREGQLRERAETVMAAAGGAIAAHEFMTGDRLPMNPHLADGNGVFPNGDTATGIVDALGLLEKVLGISRRAGVIHVSPQAAVRLSATGGMAVDKSSGVLRTVNGTVVIADQGYADGDHPASHPAATGTNEWVYATGPIDVRRSAAFVVPESVSEALDRGINKIVFRAEQLFLIVWDTQVQAAVLADLCASTCTRAA